MKITDKKKTRIRATRAREARSKKSWPDLAAAAESEIFSRCSQIPAALSAASAALNFCSRSQA